MLQEELQRWVKFGRWYQEAVVSRPPQLTYKLTHFTSRALKCVLIAVQESCEMVNSHVRGVFDLYDTQTSYR